MCTNLPPLRYVYNSATMMYCIQSPQMQAAKGSTGLHTAYPGRGLFGPPVAAAIKDQVLYMTDPPHCILNMLPTILQGLCMICSTLELTGKLSSPTGRSLSLADSGPAES